MAVDTLDTLPRSIRHRFPILERQTYLNACSQGALSDAVRDAYSHYLDDWDRQGSPWGYWVERTESARSAFAGLVNASPDEVAVLTSASAGISAIASSLSPQSGRDRIVVSDFEFPTSGQIWHAQEARGFTVTHVPQGDSPVIPLEAFEAAIDERTAVVAIAHVCFRNGARIDVEGVVKLAHARGAHVLLDSSQALASFPIDVKELGVDMQVAGVLKYPLASAGLAFLYCRSELIPQLVPTTTGWFADSDVFAMSIDRYSPAPDARRFQSGTPPVPSIYAGIAGIDLMQQIGIAETRAHVEQLNTTLIDGIDELGGTVVTPRDPASRGAMIAIRSTDDHALVAALEADNIIVSCRDGNLRVSAHCYNTHDDIKVLLDALKRERSLLR